jgi:hypothetical protein
VPICLPITAATLAPPRDYPIGIFEQRVIPEFRRRSMTRKEVLELIRLTAATAITLLAGLKPQPGNV